MPKKLRIIVTGLVGLYPVGGVAWDYLQYVIGLSKLGHEVCYHEDTWSWPYQPVEKQNTSLAAYSVNFINNFFKSYAPDLINSWHYCHLHNESYGLSKVDFHKFANTADLFINVSGNCIIPEDLSPNCIKIFLDTDPGYNQIMLSEKLGWSENIDKWVDNVNNHDQHFTYAENINNKNCLVPRLNYNWKTTRMPVIIDLWKNKYIERKSEILPWTTIMTWNAFKGKLAYKGKEYKSKGAEFNNIKVLPMLLQDKFTIGVGGMNVPRNELFENGWDVVDGPESTLTPESYQHFIFNSKGEFSIAKNVYVAMKTGWFSCRSVCYMAAGKPVVLQDTGFSKFIPTDKGVLAFSNLKEAVEAIRTVEAEYNTHCKAAKQISKEYFGYDVVLKDMLTKIGL